MALTKITSRILDSSGVTTVGTISTGVWQGTAINQTYLVGQSGTNTGDETLARINALDITELGTISSGVWNGTAIDQTYLVGQSGTNTGDQTTISGNAGTVTNGVYTVGNQTIGGVKTFSGRANFNGNINVVSANAEIWIGESTGGGGAGFLKWNDAGNYLYLGNSYNSAFNTDLVISSIGNVGIGTASPTLGKVQIEQGGDTNGLVINNTTAHPPKLYLRDAGSNGYSEIIANNNLYLNASNVGIGTTVPQYPLQVKSGTNINFSISTGVADNTAVRLNAVNDAVTANIPMEFYATKFNFNNGNVGIGTTSPSSKLQIQTTTNAGNPEVAAFLVNKSTTTNTEVRLAFAAHTNDIISTGRYSYISAKNTSGSNGQALVFATNAAGASATPKLTISSGGFVHLGGDAALVFGTNGATDPYIQAASSGDELFFGRANGFQMAIRSDNVVDFKTGIRFINGGNDTLDAYEEGTWTATMSNDGVGNTATGTYTRIGNLVHVQVWFHGKSITSSGNCRITGLPYSATASTTVGYGIMNYVHGTAINASNGGYIVSNFFDIVQDGGTGFMTWNTGSSKDAMFAGTYNIN